MKELLDLLKKKAEQKDGRLSEHQAKARMSVLEELRDLMHAKMAEDLPHEHSLEAHIEAENPEDMKNALEKAKDAIPAITEALKRDPKDLSGYEADHNLEPDVDEEKNKDMMKHAAGLDAMQEDEDMEEAKEDYSDEPKDESLEGKLKAFGKKKR